MQVFVKSFGCSTNMADGEVLAGCLAEAGWRLTKFPAKADVIVYNTCAVKGPTENRMIHVLKHVPRKKKLIVAGCLPLINFERLQKEVRFNGAVGPAIGDRIEDIVNRISKGEKVVELEEAESSFPSLDLPRLRSSPVISIIPISYGCSGSCAYCCVRFARGRLRSYGIDEIVEKAKSDLASGVHELWLVSQDTGCYGRDRDTNLAELLKALCRIEGDFRIRVGMMTPNMAEDILEDLIEAYEDEHIFKFVHLPMQSGDDEVLKRMRRFYTARDFRRMVDAFRASFPGITLSTDVICGFPGESENAFKKTLQLIEDVKPDIVNVSKFFARPKTAAAEMKKDFVSLTEIRRRSNTMDMLAKKLALEKNKRCVGWTGEVLVDEVGKVSGSWISRNYAYKPIAIRSPRKWLGSILTVKVVNVFSTHLEGEIVQ
jgi:MiaB-like tRNA modifying enzyme